MSHVSCSDSMIVFICICNVYVQGFPVAGGGSNGKFLEFTDDPSELNDFDGF